MKRYLALLLTLILLCLTACSLTAVPDDVSSQAGSVDETSSAGSETVGEVDSTVSSSPSPDGESVDSTPSGGIPSASESSGPDGSRSESSTYVKPTPLSYDDLRISPAVEYVQEDASPSDEFLAAVRDFSYTSSAQVLSGRAENTIYCPTSVYYSMALLAAGAGGATRDQILSALGLSGQSNDAFALQCQLLSCHTRQESEDSTFLTANSLWVRRGLTLQPDFGRIAAERFFAPVYAVDFADPATAGWMQDWVADNTKGLIRPSVQPDPDAALYLCNTIYLKGKWARPFFESSTSEGTFTQEDGTQITCDFMHDTRSSVFVRGSGYTRGDLEVRGIGTMSFLLPDEGVSLDTLLHSPDQLAAMLAPVDALPTSVEYSIPKVDIESNVSLREPLEAMGIRDAFHPDSADFGPMVDHVSRLYVGEVEQGARLFWDEEGIEAAAYTEILMKEDGSIMTPNKLVLDRPFLFVLHNDQGILFIGACYRPN